MPIPTSMSANRSLVITLDAFGTLFRPKRPVGQQYADLARRHGLSGFTDEQVELEFRKAFKTAQQQYPNYGKEVDMGASRWWSYVIKETFRSVKGTDSFPQRLVPDLLHRFSSSEGYELFPDVTGFFQNVRKSTIWENVSVGVISNSDDRVPNILSSLGLKLSSLRYSETATLQTAAPPKDEDIDFVVLSYDVGHEKPDRQIFDAAKRLSQLSVRDNKSTVFVHVGDDEKKDILAAEKAGWKAIHVGGFGRSSSSISDHGVFVEDLRDVMAKLNPGQ